jgi:hypothetical protein
MKRKSKSISLAMLSILVLSLALASSVTVTLSRAVDYTKVGVKLGDWAYYSYNCTGPRKVAQSSWSNINFTVTKIDRCNVTLLEKDYFHNGTLASVSQMWANLTDGTTHNGTISPLVVPNLAKGDQIYVGSKNQINDTGTMASCGDLRVYAELSLSPSTGINIIAISDARWDQATGIVIYSYVKLIGMIGIVTATATLVSTSLWSPSPAPTIDHPSAVAYTFGTTGHSITWHPSSPHPQSFILARNGTVVDSGAWNGSILAYGVDGLGVGTYLFNCTVTDGLGQSVSSVVTVSVSASQTPPPPASGLPVTIMVAVGGGIAVVVILAGIIMLRRRRV